MNLCASFGGGGSAHEVEPDHCLWAGVDFLGAMVVDLGVEICKNNKKRERERNGIPKFRVGGK